MRQTPSFRPIGLDHNACDRTFGLFLRIDAWRDRLPRQTKEVVLGSKTIKAITILFFATATFDLAPARAEEARFPNVSGKIAFEVQGDFAVDSEDPTAEGHDVFTTTEPDLKLSFTENLFARLHLVLQPMTAREPDEDRVFEDHGLFVEDLYLGFETDDFSVQGGKFTPNFGTAWDATPGTYGVDVTEDYEFTERAGLGGAVKFGGEDIGEHSLSASVFTLDTILNHSLGKSRGTLGIDDGGPSNTEKLNSWAMALDGELPLPGETAYHLGLIDQAKPYVGGGKNELGFAAGVRGAFDLGQGFGLSANAEVARFQHADNVDGQERTFVTGGAQVTYEGWNVAVAHTSRLTDTPVPGMQDFHDTQTQLTAGYAFDFGLTVDVGWKHENVGKIGADTVGFLIAYTLEFGPYALPK